MPKKDKKISRAPVIQTIHKLLEGFAWPSEIELNRTYSRLHDDHDGTMTGSITVTFSQDGDAWVEADNPGKISPLRYRSGFGGSMSPRMHAALLILALAIKWENEDRPTRTRETQGDA